MNREGGHFYFNQPGHFYFSATGIFRLDLPCLGCPGTLMPWSDVTQPCSTTSRRSLPPERAECPPPPVPFRCGSPPLVRNSRPHSGEFHGSVAEPSSARLSSAAVDWSIQVTASTLPDADIFEAPLQLGIARELSSFAGLYFDPDDPDRLVIALTDAGDFERARRIVRDHLHADGRGDADIAAEGAVLEEVEYSFIDLARYRTVLFHLVTHSRDHDVRTLGVDEFRNRVTVGLTDFDTEAAIRELLPALEIPTEAVLVVPAPEFSSAASSSDSSPARSYRSSWASHLELTDHHPDSLIEGGWAFQAVGNSRCTIGFPAMLQSDSTEVFLTASHCTAVPQGFDGGEAYQPAVIAFPSSLIGEELLDPAPFSCGLYDCVHADVAVFAASAPLNFGHVARTTDAYDCNSCSAPLTLNHTPPTLPINGQAGGVIQHETLHKVGTATGWTYGKVKSTCENVFKSEIGLWVLCSDIVSFGTRRGDSGGPVFRWIGQTGQMELRGIVIMQYESWWHGDGGVISNLNQITTHLGEQFYVWEDPLRVEVVGPAEVPSEAHCVWTAETRGGTSPYSHQWLIDGVPVDTGLPFSLSDTGTADFELGVIVTDDVSDTAYDILYVTVGPGDPCPPPQS
jgi:hypothetical protein